MKSKYLFIVSFFITFLLVAQSKEQLNTLDIYYEKSLKEWQVPGMAIAIVTSDSIIFSKGYGFANLKNKTKVDGNTLFAIASNSKAFTASSLAQLVEQGKLKWDAKVKDYLPEFKMYNDFVTQDFTIEDLLCHRSGLVTFSGDLLWYGTTLSPSEIINKQQYLKPRYNFRTTFGYSNIAYIAAGEVLKKISGNTWDEYVSTHFLKPLKMDRTLTSSFQLKNTNNIATPYYVENNEAIELEWVNWDNVAAAGALISSVNDVAKWLQLNINQGYFNNKSYFNKEYFNKLTTPHVNFSVEANDNKVNFKSYGLGWSIQDYQGYKIVSHGGGYDGMISKSFFIPEKKIGVIILTNSINWLPSALTNKTLDILLADKKDGRDWSSYYLKYYKQQESTATANRIENENLRGKINKKQLAKNEYVGIYKDKMYGTVTVLVKNKKLHFKMDNTSIFFSDLHHWNHNIFTFRFPKYLSSLPEGKLWFDLDKNGKVFKLNIDVPNPDFDFTEFEFIKQ